MEGIILRQDLQSKLPFDEITYDFMDSLSLLEPFGHDNPPPILYTDVIQTRPPKVVGKFHLKLFLEQNNRSLEGIAFGFAKRKSEISAKNLRLRIAFTPYINRFLKKTSIQLQIKDFEIRES
jgi:single-stranded-DNA-specific exonuclease